MSAAAGGGAEALVGNLLGEIEGLFGHSSSDDSGNGAASRRDANLGVDRRSSLKSSKPPVTKPATKPSGSGPQEGEGSGVGSAVAGGAASAFFGNILGEIEGLFHHDSSSTNTTSSKRIDASSGSIDARSANEPIKTTPIEHEPTLPPKSPAKTNTNENTSTNTNENENEGSHSGISSGIKEAIAGSAAGSLVSGLIDEVKGLFHHSSNSTKRDDSDLKPIPIATGPLPVPTHSFGGGDIEDEVKGFLEGALKKVKDLVRRSSEFRNTR